MKIGCTILWLCLCWATGAAWASGQKEAVAGRTQSNVFIGAEAFFMSGPSHGTPTRISPVPFFGFAGERVHLPGISGGDRLFQGEGWSIGPILQPRMEGYGSRHASKLTSMEDHRIPVDAGLEFLWRTNWGVLRASWVTDILGRHGGYETEFAYTLPFLWRGFDVIPSAGIRCKSANLTNYYYGVPSDEAFPGRPSYKADSVVDPFIRLTVRRELIEDLSVLSAVQCEWLDDEIRDSPIMNRAHSASFLIGLLYTF
jgi:outer membrane protein